MIKALLEKIKESLMAVVPITIVVLILCCIFPVSGWTIFAFLIGAIMLIFGLSFFNLGADSSMMKMGEQIGQFVTKKKNIWMLIGVTVAIGLIITIAEPDLMVLAEQMQHTIPKVLLIVMVALGVGVFLALALVRIVLQIKLNVMLIILYLIVFLIAIFVPNEFIAVAFDSGGVTTGPMTVPFILALGLGVAGARGSNASKDDSFGLVSFCSIIIFAKGSNPFALATVALVFFFCLKGLYISSTSDKVLAIATDCKISSVNFPCSSIDFITSSFLFSKFLK